MAKKPSQGAGGRSPRGGPKGDTTTLTVSLDAAELVGKAAGVKNLTIRQLFDLKEVRSFFRHVIAAEADELKKEDEHQSGLTGS